MKLIFEPNFSIFDTRKKIILPQEMSNELAELIGILTGDGCIALYKHKIKKASFTYYISITGSSEYDKEYFNFHVAKLFERVFNIKPKFYKIKGQNTIRLVACSKAIFYFLKDIGMNIGPKVNLEIPRIIIEDIDFLIPFIRGLFDTDGSIALKSYNHEYPVISIKLKSRKIIEQLELILRNFGFSMYVEYGAVTNDERGFSSKGSRIYIYGRKNLRKWVDIIGFSNSRHLKKIEKGMGTVGTSPTVQRRP